MRHQETGAAPVVEDPEPGPEVTPDLLSRLVPRLILSPLLARNFDCVDLAQLLWSLGYDGRYRAIDAGLPDPALIVREVRQLVPTLDFDIVPLG